MHFLSNSGEVTLLIVGHSHAHEEDIPGTVNLRAVGK
jgi:hypothetical protein